MHPLLVLVLVLSLPLATLATSQHAQASHFARGRQMVALQSDRSAAVRQSKGRGNSDKRHFSGHHLGRSLQLIPGPHILLERYLSNQEMDEYIEQYTKRCPHLARRDRVGRSLQGQDMVALVITSNISSGPSISEDKPAFKYVANIHGDEPSGRHLLLLLAEHLCAEYGSDPAVTRLLDGIELYLLPSINPDGFTLHRRENKHMVDLNRNFPDPVHLRGRDLRLPTGKEQGETLALMNFTLHHRFAASLSLHEGAILANYPYDGYADGSMAIKQIKHAAPDDSTFVYLAKLYARLHTTMSKSKDFRDGITNGAQWYPVYGGMQDWNYLAGGCLELTLELTDDKWPNMTRLQYMWEENRRALVEWPLVAVLGGVRGHVRSNEKQPLEATIMVDGIAHNSSTWRQTGAFNRPLAPGTYILHALATGYQPFSASIIVPEDMSGVALEIQLQPVGAAAGPTVQAAGQQAADSSVSDRKAQVSAGAGRKEAAGGKAGNVAAQPHTTTSKPAGTESAMAGAVSGTVSSVVSAVDSNASAPGKGSIAARLGTLPTGTRAGHTPELGGQQQQLRVQPAQKGSSALWRATVIIGVQLAVVGVFLAWRRYSGRTGGVGSSWWDVWSGGIGGSERGLPMSRMPSAGYQAVSAAVVPLGTLFRSAGQSPFRGPRTS